MPLHSIIIPCRGYQRYLRHCIRSIEHAAWIARKTADDYEVLEVIEGATAKVADPPVKWIAVPQGGRYFNKPRLQNIGLDHARGDTLTFLDADALVGPRWFDCLDALLWLSRPFTKLCYRVRLLPESILDGLDKAAQDGIWERKYLRCFEMALMHECAFEGYGKPEQDFQHASAEERLNPNLVFGNSHFSITRAALGDLRFNEKYEGRGFEDLWMNREIWHRHGEAYRAFVVTEPKQTIMCIRNPDPPPAGWGPGEQNEANARRYAET